MTTTTDLAIGDVVVPRYPRDVRVVMLRRMTVVGFSGQLVLCTWRLPHCGPFRAAFARHELRRATRQPRPQDAAQRR